MDGTYSIQWLVPYSIPSDICRPDILVYMPSALLDEKLFICDFLNSIQMLFLYN